jgi:hypothetical protein
LKGMDQIIKTPAGGVVDQVNTMPVIHQDEPASKDKAAILLQQTGRTVELTPENNKRVLRKIDSRVLPVILGV